MYMQPFAIGFLNAQRVIGNQQAHDIGRALFDLLQFGIAAVFFNGHLQRVAHAAVDFHGHSGSLDGRFTGNIFGDGNFPRKRAILIIEPGPPPHQQAGRVRQGNHFGNTALDQLILRDRPVKLGALIGVRHGTVHTGLGQPHRTLTSFKWISAIGEDLSPSFGVSRVVQPA